MAAVRARTLRHRASLCVQADGDGPDDLLILLSLTSFTDRGGGGGSLPSDVSKPGLFRTLACHWASRQTWQRPLHLLK